MQRNSSSDFAASVIKFSCLCCFYCFIEFGIIDEAYCNVHTYLYIQHTLCTVQSRANNIKKLSKGKSASLPAARMIHATCSFSKWAKPHFIESAKICSGRSGEFEVGSPTNLIHVYVKREICETWARSRQWSTHPLDTLYINMCCFLFCYLLFAAISPKFKKCLSQMMSDFSKFQCNIKLTK